MNRTVNKIYCINHYHNTN